MNKLIIFTIGIAFGVASHAGEDPRFSFEAASKAFKHGRAPLLPEISGSSWSTIGSVMPPGTPELFYVGYWPDQRIQGDDIIFRNDLVISGDTDAFGSAIITVKEEVFDFGKGTIVASGSTRGSIDNKQLVHRFEGTRDECGIRSECRMSDSPQMLICAAFLNDPRRMCDGLRKISPLNITGRTPTRP